MGNQNGSTPLGVLGRHGVQNNEETCFVRFLGDFKFVRAFGGEVVLLNESCQNGGGPMGRGEGAEKKVEACNQAVDVL